MRYLKNSREWQLHMIMALIGGYIGTYALFLRGSNFGSAMTGNFLEIMLLTAEEILEAGCGNGIVILIRLGAVLVFGSGVICAYLLNSRTKLPAQRVTLAVEAVIAAAASWIPEEVDPVLALYPIFFMSSFQWGTFSGVKEFNCATIFSTNNFRQCVTGWTEYFLTHQEKDRRKGAFYGLTILHFLAGGLAGALFSMMFGPVCLLICLLPIAAAALLTGENIFPGKT